jgi:flavin-dependent dehydrogenase
MFDYDVIAVGCGPAGLMACIELTKRGFKAAGIDIKVRLDKNYRAAAGFLLSDQDFNGEYIRSEPQGDKTLFTFEKTGFSFLYPGKTRAVHKSHLISNGGIIYTAAAVKKPFMHTMDPTTWLKGLYEEALSYNIPLYTKTMLVNVREIPGGMEIDIRKNGKKTGSMTCRKLIASDGLSSRVAKRLGMNRDRALMDSAPTVEYHMENVETPFDEGDIGVFGRDNLGLDGFIIMVPCVYADREYRMETVAHGPAANNLFAIEYFIKKSRFSKWFKNARMIGKHSALMEMYPAMKKPYKGNTIFLGDSAAMAESLYPGATASGYKGALAIEKEFAGENGFEEYADWWCNDALEMTSDVQQMAEYAKRFLFNVWMGPDVMDSLFKLAKKAPMIVDEFNGNPYGFARSIIEHLQSLPGIKPEWEKRLEELKQASMTDFIGVIEQIKKNNADVDRSLLVPV